jgi:hypothetical protein
VRGGVDGSLLALAERADRARRLRWVALALAVLLGAVAVLAGDSRRAGAFRLGVTVGLAGAVVAVVASVAPAVAATNVGPADREAARAVIGVWSGPLRTWALAFTAIGGIVALAAATTRPSLSHVRTPRRVRPLRAALAALGAVAAVILVAAASDDGAPAASTGACNGHAALCGRRVDDVAFLGTHNSMSADREPGWLFPAQDAGITQQLDAGVRALLVDTHYGIGTPRGVATDLSGENATRAKLVAEVGEEFVDTAERIGRRIGRDPQGERAVYLCHTLCEVGATRAVDAFRGVHRFLVRHPNEVVILSIQDDTTAEDTARVIRESGLSDEVYQGRPERPWPTLRELIDRDQRVIVLAENHPGGAPWIHRQPAVMQETPFHFRDEAALAAPDSCKPNRGGTEGSLLLVNHWVDTSPAPRVTIARRVNARGFLERRVDRCRTERKMLPNVLAIDFYRQGDAAAEVDRLNRLP